MTGGVLQNLALKANGTTYGLNQASVAASTYTFSQQLSIAAGASVTLDVYADILSSANVSGVLVSLPSAQATGLITGTSYNVAATVTGQTVTV